MSDLKINLYFDWVGRAILPHRIGQYHYALFVSEFSSEMCDFVVKQFIIFFFVFKIRFATYGYDAPISYNNFVKIGIISFLYKTHAETMIVFDSIYPLVPIYNYL